MTHYIGIDGHSKTCTLVTVDELGQMEKKANIATHEGQILKYIRSHEGEKRAVVEESSLSQWFYLLLKDEVDELIICNPSYIGRRPGPKNDFLDAMHLANELRCNHVTAVHHEDTPMWALRSLVHGYLDVTLLLTQTKNRYKSMFRSQALETKGLTIYTDEPRIEELSSAAMQFVAKSLFSQLQQLQAAKNAYVPEFKAYAKKHRPIKQLCTIPGIDTIRATIIAAFVCSPDRFANKHKFWAYCMLVKHNSESDGRSYGNKSVAGRRELKSVFDGAAFSALQGGSSLRKHYDELREKKKLDPKAAKKAIARRIAAISLTILRNGKAFDDHYEEKKGRLDNK